MTSERRILKTQPVRRHIADDAVLESSKVTPSEELKNCSQSTQYLYYLQGFVDCEKPKNDSNWGKGQEKFMTANPKEPSFFLPPSLPQSSSHMRTKHYNQWFRKMVSGAVFGFNAENS